MEEEKERVEEEQNEEETPAGLPAAAATATPAPLTVEQVSNFKHSENRNKIWSLYLEIIVIVS